MARARKTTKKAPKTPVVDLSDMETRFAFTGRSTVTWFQLFEEDDYGKFGGNVFPQDMDKVREVVQDLIDEAQDIADAAGVEVQQVLPFKTNDDGDEYVKINRKATKKDGSDVTFKFRAKNGKKRDEPEDELGNGSTVNIKYYASAYFMPESEPAPGTIIPARIGVSMGPLEIQIIDHKVYEGGDDEWGDESEEGDEDENDGFSDEDDGDDY